MSDPGGGTGGGVDDGGPDAGPGEPYGFTPSLPPRRVRQGEPPTRTRRRRRRWKPLLLLIGTPIIVVLALVTLWYELNANALGAQGRLEVITVHSGESVSGVINDLSSHHVIASTLAFKFGDFLHGDPSVTPGSYALHRNIPYGDIRSILGGGPNIGVVRVDPGLTLHEVAQRVDDVNPRESFTQVAASGVVASPFSPPGSKNLEGMLGVGTYLVLPHETDTQVLAAMVARFDAQASASGLNVTTASALGLTPYQLLTAASVVQKEGFCAGCPDSVIAKNMPAVARVIYNRLARNMMLAMDSTVLYALGRDGGPVTHQDEQFASPYNTYLNKGLPPTPICSSSTTALAAAVHPASGSWLYFVVVKRDGTEAFSDTFAEQQANEQLAKANGIG